MKTQLLPRTIVLNSHHHNIFLKFCEISTFNQNMFHDKYTEGGIRKKNNTLVIKVKNPTKMHRLVSSTHTISYNKGFRGLVVGQNVAQTFSMLEATYITKNYKTIF